MITGYFVAAAVVLFLGVVGVGAVSDRRAEAAIMVVTVIATCALIIVGCRGQEPPLQDTIIASIVAVVIALFGVYTGQWLVNEI